MATQLPPEEHVVVKGIEISIADLALLVFRWSLAVIPTALFWYVVYRLAIAAFTGD